MYNKWMQFDDICGAIKKIANDFTTKSLWQFIADAKGKQTNTHPIYKRVTAMHVGWECAMHAIVH